MAPDTDEIDVKDLADPSPGGVGSEVGPSPEVGSSPEADPRDQRVLQLTVARILDELSEDLLSRRNGKGHWRGRLCSSALSTAVACVAMTLFDQDRQEKDLEPEHRTYLDAGLGWLAANANADGGWGDTVRSVSNLPTTVLAWSALSCGPAALGEAAAARRTAIEDAEAWIEERTGDLEPESLKSHIEGLYGKDKTFSVPILTLAALAGTLGPEPECWDGPPALPFELAAVPQSMFRFVGMPVVSYALPALIAVGQVRHHRRPSGNPALRALRQSSRKKTLKVLQSVLPESGGFLEAIPLTGFVTLSLVGAGEAEHPVTLKCLEFLRESMRPDGDWPIDIDLATWVSTLSIQALGDADLLGTVPDAELQVFRRWLLDQQYKIRHPFTGADPGGWAWTDLPGGVPDADDTAGALLALARLGPIDREARDAAAAALGWLMGLQNQDGGIPTFCKGWTRLPFDASAPDLTAHALRAFRVWRPHVPPSLNRQLMESTRRAVDYLRREQREDGSWVPLWFGHEAAPNLENKVFGTARVLRAFSDDEGTDLRFEDARSYLLEVQNADGGWGGDLGVASSVEETALVVAAFAESKVWASRSDLQEAAARGAAYLAERWDEDRFANAAPIGFYFANLWYFEDLYPHTFALSALGVLNRALASG